VVSDKKIFKISANENTLWTLAAMLDLKLAPKHKSSRGPSNEHFWQVWLKSVQRFQRRRYKCEKLTDGRTDGRTDERTDDRRLAMTKAHMAYGQVN
jgi:hypothetical protein